MIKFKTYLTAISILFTAFTTAQNTVAQYPQMYENQVNLHQSVADKNLLTAKEKLDIRINSMMDDPVLRNADWGIVIYDPKTNKVISSYNESSALIPASTTKLLTTETAISLLGSDFRWLTQLDYSGNISSDGTLEGNLYIIGSGDPTIGTGKAGSWSYSEIAADFTNEIALAGIKRINGDIIVENGVFKNKNATLPENIVWLETNNYYLPVGSTKDINPRNEQLVVKQKNPFDGEEKRYFYVSPYIHSMVFANKFDGTDYLTTELPNNAVNLTNLFRATLIKNGIPVSGKVIPRTIDVNPGVRQKITAYESPRLADIIFYTNQRSDNALAESLLRMVGFQKAGNQDVNAGKDVVFNHLMNRGFDVQQLSYADGSGLSRTNKVTPISQVKFLADLMKEPYYKDYFNSLPVGGQSGTLKRMFFGEGYGQVFAKTGTLNRVKALAGYLKTNSGRTLTFSILVNNYSGSVSQVKDRMEQLLDPALDL